MLHFVFQGSATSSSAHSLDLLGYQWPSPSPISEASIFIGYLSRPIQLTRLAMIIGLRLRLGSVTLLNYLGDRSTLGRGRCMPSGGCHLYRHARLLADGRLDGRGRLR